MVDAVCLGRTYFQPCGPIASGLRTRDSLLTKIGVSTFFCTSDHFRCPPPKHGYLIKEDLSTGNLPNIRSPTTKFARKELFDLYQPGNFLLCRNITGKDLAHSRQHLFCNIQNNCLWCARRKQSKFLSCVQVLTIRIRPTANGRLLYHNLHFNTINIFVNSLQAQFPSASLLRDTLQPRRLPQCRGLR